MPEAGADIQRHCPLTSGRWVQALVACWRLSILRRRRRIVSRLDFDVCLLHEIEDHEPSDHAVLKTGGPPRQPRGSRIAQTARSVQHHPGSPARPRYRTPTDPGSGR